ncbi:MAG: outer membrane protein assembly factor BamB [Planctomycetota bacterium]
MKPGKLIVALSLAAVIVSCSKNKDNSEPPALLVDIDQPIALQHQWSIDTNASGNRGGYRLRPLILDNQVFTIDSKGAIKSYLLTNGKKLWNFDTGLAVITGLGGNAQVLVAASKDGEVVAFRQLKEGLEKIWQTNIASEVRAAPVVDKDRIFIRSIDGKLRSLSAETGVQQWEVSRRVPALSLTGNSEPLVIADRVISGFDDGKLIAYDRSNGKIAWESTVSRPQGRSEIERLVDVDGSFVSADGVIYVSSYQGQLVAIQGVSGDILWARDFSSFQPIAIDSGTIYLSMDNSHIWAIDRRTGAALWRQDALNARRVTAPVLVGDKLVVADLEGYLHWLDRAEGRLLGRIRPTEVRNYVEPQLWQNALISLDKDGILSLVVEQE